MARKKPVRNTRRSLRGSLVEPVTHHEFVALSASVDLLRAQVERNRTDLDIQLQRISQLQLDLDVTRKMLVNRIAAEAELIDAQSKITFDS